MLTEEQFLKISEIIRASSPQSPRLINSFLSGDGTLSRLLRPANTKSVRISKNTREFSADGPFYLDCVDFYSDNPAFLEMRLELVAIGIDGSGKRIEGKSIEITNQEGKKERLVRFSVKKVCSKIQVSADTLFKSVMAARVRAYGYSEKQFDEAGKKLVEVLQFVEKLEQYVQSKQKSAELANEEKASAETAKGEIQRESDEVVARMVQAKSELKKLENFLSAKAIEKENLVKDIEGASAGLTLIKNNETQLSQSVENLNRSISDKKLELQEIVNDRSLISDEYKDYVIEGSKQSRTYEWFLLFSIFVLALCAFQLYTGARRILVADVESYAQIIGLILQRAPFAAALVVLITVAWKLSALFVGRIMKIHEQRLALARLLVIAKDTVYSSMDGLSITDEQKFRERIKLKLQMLRSHLTAELGSDFKYGEQESSAAVKQQDNHADASGGDDSDED